MTVMILLGFAALPTLNMETFPEIKLNKVSVSVPYPGAGPNEVEEGLCNRLEDATDGISFLEEQICVARDNVGVLTLEMAEGSDLSQFIDDIHSAVDSITDFPDDAEEPVIEELGRTEAVVSVAINADLTQPELKALAEYYRNRLLALPDVPMVSLAILEDFGFADGGDRLDPQTSQLSRG
jgi:multidrug efflux pump subunit AcrB